MSDHAARARSFDEVAQAYEFGRPGYPQAAIDWWTELGAFTLGGRVLDLAAGTGKLTRLLVERADVVAVEPLANMRAELSVVLPDVEVLEGSAERIPLDDTSVDAVFVAQAFHWFDHAAALGEIRRVLRPGGGLALIWNDEDPTADAGWVRFVERHKRDGGGGTVQTGIEATCAAIESDPRFGPIERKVFAWSEPTTAERVIADLTSRSYVIVMPDDERAAFVAPLYRELAEVDGDAPLAHPRLAHAFWCPTI